MENIFQTCWLKKMHKNSPLLQSVKADWALIIFLPILMWLISDRWMFFPVKYWYDPWFNLGIFLNYEYLASSHPNTYFITRLPSIIPHFFAYKLLSPYAAVVATTFLKFYLCIIPLYWSLWEITKNRLTSLLTIFILSFFPYFLSSIGWHYVDGLGIGYISLATAFFIAACKKENWKLWLFLAGFAQALMLFNYLFVATFIVIQTSMFVIYNKEHAQRSLLTCLFLLGTGGLFCTLSLSSFSYYFNGTFFFFLPQIKAAIHLSSMTYIASGKSSVWYTPFTEWLPTSTWLSLTALIFILTIHYFIKCVKDFKADASFFLKIDTLIVLQFLSACFFYIILEFLGFNFLQFFYTANYLLPFGALALGVILSKSIPYSQYENWLIVIISCTFYAFFSLKGNAAEIGKTWDCVASHFIGMLAFSTLFIKSSNKKQKICYLLLSVVCVALSFKRVTINENNYPYKDHSDHKLVVHLHRYIKGQIPSQGNYAFWYNIQTDGLGSFFQPLSATFMNSGAPATVFSNLFPEIYEEDFLEKVKSTIILLSSESDAIPKAEKALKQKGYGWDILKQEYFSLGGKRFLMLAFLLKSIEIKNEN